MKKEFGFVVSVTGSRAAVRFYAGMRAGDAATIRLAVGRLVAIRTQVSLVVGVIARISGPDVEAREFVKSDFSAEIDLLGEIMNYDSDSAFFERGVSEYPSLGDKLIALDADDLTLIHHIAEGDTINVGHLKMDATVPAYINFDEMLRKHFAILGTTGVGKSSSVALILREILQKEVNLRLLLIDPHSEYGHCFGSLARVVSPKNLKLPFWLFNLEEIVDVFFQGRPGVEDEIEILTELIPIAKARLASAMRGERMLLAKSSSSGFTPNSPVPYRIADLVELIDDRMGKLENKKSAINYHRLKARIETLVHDARYSFMFDGVAGDDVMADVVGDLFRLPVDGHPITVVQLAGFPPEVVDSVVSVLCRLAFDLGVWSHGAAPLLVVCEEIHRYAPSDPNLGFGPTRKAISRIAKEGRKYCVFLGAVTQRPADLDATILSQCGTVFAMRMANDRDQAIIRSAVSDAGASLIEVLPSLGVREAIAFGEGVALPTRLRFGDLQREFLPFSQTGNALDDPEKMDERFLSDVIDRWRESTRTASKERRGASSPAAPGLAVGQSMEKV